jgi:hypothetical protein
VDGVAGGLLLPLLLVVVWAVGLFCLNLAAHFLRCSAQVAIPPLGHDGGLAAASAVLEDVIPFADVANPVLAQVGQGGAGLCLCLCLMC